MTIRANSGARGRRRRQVVGSEGEQSKLTGIALKRAHLVPSAAFASPAAVVRSKALSPPQKIAILRRWEFDLRQRRDVGRVVHALSVEIRLLDEVRSALAELGAPIAGAHEPEMSVVAH